MYQSYNKQLHKAELGSDNGAWNFGMYWLRPNLDHRKLSKSWKTGLDRLSFWESIWPLTSYFRFTHQISLFFTQKNAFLQPFTEIHILPLQLHVVGRGSTVVWQGTDLSCSSYFMILWYPPTIQIKDSLWRSLCQPLLTAVPERLLWILTRQAVSLTMEVSQILYCSVCCPHGVFFPHWFPLAIFLIVTCARCLSPFYSTLPRSWPRSTPNE